MKQDLYTIQEVATLLNVSPKTLRRWEETGRIKPIRTAGNQRRYRPDDVKKLQRRITLQKARQEIRKEVVQEKAQPVVVSAPVVKQPSPVPSTVGFMPLQQEAAATPAQPVEPVAEETIPQVINPEPVQQVIPFSVPQVREAEKELTQNGSHFRNAFRVLMGVSAILVILLVAAVVWQKTGYPGLHPGVKGLATSQTYGTSKAVLAANDAKPNFQLQINLPSFFGKKVNFLDDVGLKKSLTVTGLSQLNGGIKTNNADINAGKGKLTASNVVYSILPGSNIVISGDKQNPTISAVGGVTSLQGLSGAVVLTGGSGIGISGTTITNTDRGSAQAIFKTITAGGTNITAGNNTDQISFAAGSGITVTGDAGSKTITIASTSQGTLTGLTTNGVLYATSGTNATSTGVGPVGTVLHGTGGIPSFSAVDLTADVTGVLPIGNGGTGTGTTPTSGQILIGNGTGYSLGQISGTANQITVTNGSGTISLSLPQDIASSSTPKFAAMSLTNNTNQLTLGTGSTGTITLAALSGNRTYTFPDSSGTVCLIGSGCGGAAVGGSGTTNYLARFVDANDIGIGSIYDNGHVGIGTTSPQGLFSVSGGVVGEALVSLNNTNLQDILTGSASGATRFVFDANGDLNLTGAYQVGGVSGITQATPSCVTTVGGIVTGFGSCQTGNEPWTVASGAIFTGNSTLDFLLGNSATASAKFGVININGGTPTATISGTGSNALFLTGDGTLATTNRQTLAIGSTSTGNIAIGNGASGVALNLGGDATGDLYFRNAGGILSRLGIGGTNQILTVSGGLPAWSNAGGTLNYWQENSGALSPFNLTDDLLLGATSTSSARFAFVNNTGTGVPTASISANNGNYATYLTGNGTLGTTNKQTLTIGSLSTGSIDLFGFGSGLIHSDASGFLSSGAVALNSADVTGTLPIGKGGTNTGSIGGAGTIAYSDGSAYAFSLAGTTGQALVSGGTSAPTWFAPTQGSLIFAGASGALAQNNAQLFFDNTNNLLGIGTATPIAKLDVEGAVAGKALTVLNYTGTDQNILTASKSGTTEFTVGNDGKLAFAGGANFLQTLTSNATQAQTLNIPNLTATSADFCFSTGNCAGSGSSVTQSGTNASGQIAYFTNGNNITSSANFLFNNALSVAGSNGGAAAAVINQVNSGDIFTASASGITKFTIANDGTISDAKYAGGNNAILYAASANGAFTTVTTGLNSQCLLSGPSGPGWGSCVQGNTTWIEANGTIYPGNSTEDLLVGGNATTSAKFAFINVAAGAPTASIAGSIANTALSLSGDGAIATTNRQTLAIGSTATGNIAIGNGASGVALNLGGDATGDLYFRNAGGTLSRLGIGGTNQILTVSGGLPAWSNAGGTLNYWQENSGALSPFNLTDDLLLGATATSSAKFAFSNVAGGTPTASIAGSIANNALFLTGDGTLGTTNKQSLTIGSLSTGNINLANSVFANAGLTVASGQNLTLSGITGNNQILYATSGTGAVAGVAATGLGNQCLLSSVGGTPVWGACDSGNTSWVQANGTIYPGNSTEDLLVGGTATSSARFAFTNVSNGVPTASVSATTGGGSYLSADGTLATTNAQSLTIGSAATGNITLLPGAGKSVTISGLGSGVVQSNAGVLSASALDLSGANVTGILPVTRGGSPFEVTNGAITQRITTEDFLLGGTATASAAFAVTGISTTTPVASLSGTTGGSYLSASGNLATTNRLTLALGGGATGNISLQDARLASSVLLTQTATGFDVGLGTNGIIDAINKAFEAAGGSGGGGVWTLNGNVIYPSNIANQVGIGTQAVGNGQLVINQPNAAGDIFAASKSGATRFIVSNNGNLSFSGAANFLTTLTSPNITANESVEIPDTAGAADVICLKTIHNCVGTGGGVSESGSNANGQIAYFTNGSNITSSANFLFTNALSVAGANGGAAATVINQLNSGDIFSASASGIAKFTIANDGTLTAPKYTTNGGILYTNGTNGLIAQTSAGSPGQILQSNGSGAPTWVNAASVGTNYWQLLSGALSPFSSTADLLVGGTATTGAKFAFVNVNNGTPTASIAGSIANNALFLTGDGTLGTTNKQSLTIGSLSTGNINLANSVFANAGLTVASGQNLTLSGITGNNQILYGTSGTGVVAGVAATGIGNQCLLSGAGGTPTWGSCVGGNTTWNEGNGTIYPGNVTEDLLVGGNSTASAKFAFINVAGNNTPTASISGANSNALSLSATGTIQTTNAQSLLLNPNGLGNVGIGTTTPAKTLSIVSPSQNAILNLYGQSTTGSALDYGVLEVTSSGGGISAGQERPLQLQPNGGAAGTVGIGVGGNTNPLATLDVRGNASSLAIASFSGITTNGGLVVDNSGTGDLLDINNDGARKFTILNNGNVQLNNYTATNGVLYTNNSGLLQQATTGSSNLCLLSGASTPTWGACDSGNTSWVQANGTIYPGNSTEDLLVGGTATGSAKFAFINVAGSNTPTASISANNGNNATYLTGNGTLGTTNGQTLTVGSPSTGDIAFRPGGQAVGNSLYLSSNGNVGLGEAANYKLSVASTDSSNYAADFENLSTGNGVKVFVQQESSVTDALSIQGWTGTTTLQAMNVKGNGMVGIGTDTPLSTLDVRANPTTGGTISIASVSGATTFAGLLVDNSGSGDLFTASKSGASKFTILNNGNLQANNYNVNNGLLYTNASGVFQQLALGGSGTCLMGGASLTWSACAAGTNLFQESLGALSPSHITDDLLLGGTSTASARFAFTNNIGTGTPTASISGANNNALSLTATGTIQTTNAQSLLLNPNGFGNVGIWTANPLYPLTVNGTIDTTGSTGSVQLNARDNSGNFSSIYSAGGDMTFYTSVGGIRAVLLNNGRFGIGPNAGNPANAMLDVAANTYTVPVASFSGQTGLATLLLDQSGVGDIFTASKSGASKFTILNNGNIQLNNYTSNGGVLYTNGTTGLVAQSATGNNGQVLQLVGSTPTWVDAGAAGITYWQVNGNALSPINAIDDLLLGGSSTSSAKFAFINNAGTGVPTASISANSGNNATYLTGSGTLGTTNGQTLTLGSASTGNIAFTPQGANVAAISKDNNGTFQLNDVNDAGVLFKVNNIYPSVNFPRTFFQGGQSTGDSNWLMRFADAYSSSSQNITAGIQISDNNDAAYTNAHSLQIAMSAAGTPKALIYTTDGQSFGGQPIELDTNSAGDVATPNLYLDTVANGYRVGIGTNAPAAQLDIRGQVGTIPVASFSGATTNAGVIVDQAGSGDIFTASKSGATKFTILNNGNIQANNYNSNNGLLYTNASGVFQQLAIGGSGTCLMGGASLTWSACAAGTNLFQENLGALSPSHITDDLLLGGSSTASARFAFTNNIGAGTPTASISGANNNALSLTATGTIQTTNAQSLLLNPNGLGNVGVGTSAPIDPLTVNGNIAAVGSNGGLKLYGTDGQGESFKLYSATGDLEFYSTQGPGIVADISQGGRFGIGVNISGNQAAQLDVRGSSNGTGVLPVASFSGSTSFANTIIDQSGSGDIFTASKSGATKFVITNAGNVGIGVNPGNNPLQVGTNLFSVDPFGNISNAGIISSGSTIFARSFSTTASALNATQGVANATVPVAIIKEGATPGAGADLLQLQDSSSNVLTKFNSNGQLVIQGLGNTTPNASVSGASTFASLLVDNAGTGDLFTASKSGATKFTILNNGNISFAGNTNFLNTITTAATAARTYTLPDATGTICVSGQTCATSGTVGYFQRNAGALAPANITDDLLLGGTSTASARFAFTNNIGTGTPTASISANSGNNATFLSGNGTLGTTNGQTLTLGTATTGQVQIGETPAAAFGNTRIGSAGASDNGLITGQQFTTPVGVSGTVTSMSVYVHNGVTGGSKIQMAIYSDTTSGCALSATDCPNSLIASTAQVTPTNNAWNTVAINATLSSNTTYWLVYWTSDTTLSDEALVNPSSAGNYFVFGSATFGASMPSTFPAITFHDNTYDASIYASFSGNSGPAMTIDPNSGNINLGYNEGLYLNGPSSYISNNQGITNSEVFGANAQTFGQNSTVLGKSAQATDSNAVAIGYVASSVINGVSIGYGSSSVGAGGGVAIGYSSSANTVGIALGQNSSAGFIYSIAQGYKAQTTAANQLVFGGNQASSGYINDAYFGSGVTDATPIGSTINATGGNGTNIAGANLTLAGGKGTGNAAGGSLLFSTSAAGTSGTTLQSLVTRMSIDNNGNVGIGTSNALSTLDVRGNTGTTPVASFSGATTNAGVIVDQSGSGDLFTASKSGATKFTINNAGNIVAPNYAGNNAVLFAGAGTGLFTTTTTSTGGLCLLSGAGNAPTWGNCVGGNTTWQEANGTIYAGNTTEDLLLGATATSSAKFAVLNIADSLTPVASLSAGTSGGAYFSAAGNIQTTANQTLTLGGTTTGNIQFKPGNNANSLFLAGSGRVGIGTTNPLATLDVRSQSGTLPSASISGATTNASVIVDQSGSGDIFTASKSGATKFVITNAGNVAIGTNTSSVPLTVNGTLNAGDLTNPIQIMAWSSMTSWINMPSVAGLASGIGSGGPGGNAWIAYTGNAGNWFADSTAGDIAYRNQSGKLLFGNSGGANNAAMAISSDLIGMGTVNPLAKLDVRGKVATSPIASLSGATTNASVIVDQSGSGDIFTASKSGATKFVIGNNGTFQTNGATAVVGYNRVGTGTTSNGFLSNANDLLITGKFEVAGSLQVDNGLVINGTQGTVGWIQRNNNAISPSNITDDLLLGGTSTASARFAFTGNAGNATPIASISAQSGAGGPGLVLSPGQVQSLNAGTLNLGGSTTGDIGFQSGGAGYDMYLTSRGRLGLGTTNPSDFIDVEASNGNITVGGGGFFYNNATTNNVKALFNGSGDFLSIQGDASNVFSFGDLTTKTLTNGTPVLSLKVNNGAGGSVGIGTINPLATLDVRANPVNGATTAIASLSGKSTNAGLIVDNSGKGDLITASSAGLTRFTITQSGNLGLGVPVSDFNPSLNGGISTTLHGNIMTGANIQAGDQNLSEGVVLLSPNTLGGSGNITFFDQPGNNLGNIGSNGNGLELGADSAGYVELDNGFGGSGKGTVGINTLTAPLATLDVRTNWGTAAIASISGATTFANTVIDQSGSGDIFTASKSGATKFVITNSGNVGIGTSNPAQLFTIQPTINGQDTFVVNQAGTNNPGLDFRSYNNGGQMLFYNGTSVETLINGAGSSYFDNGLTVGTNFGSTVAVLDVRGANDPNNSFQNGTAGTVPSASISAQTSSASVIVDNDGVGDLFTASKSGATKFTITNTGNVNIGVTNPTAAATLWAATTNSGSVAKELTLGNLATGNNTGAQITFNLSTVTNNTAADIYAKRTNTFGSGSTYLAFETNNGSGTQEDLRLSEIGGAGFQTSAIGNGALVVNQPNAGGDIFSASVSGATKFTINNAGNIVAPNYAGNNAVLFAGAGTGLFTTATTNTSGLCLISSGTNAPGWGSCVGGNTFFSQANGAIFAGNTTEDLLLGGTATSSADFAVTGIAGTTPAASISATAGTKNGISLDASTSTIQSLNRNTLVLGGGTTGDIQFKPGNSASSLYLSSNGRVGIGNITPANALDVTGAIAASTHIYSTDFDTQTNTTLNIGANNANAVSIGNTGVNNTLTLFGVVVHKPFINTNTAFQQQNAAGNSVFTLGTTATSPVATVAASTTNAAVIVDQSGLGDIFTASSSGMQRFTIKNNGSVFVGNQGAGAFANTGILNVIPTSINQKGLVFQGLAGQTADLLDFYSNTGFVSGYDANGNEYLSNTLNMNGTSGGFIQSAANKNLGINNNSGTFVGIGTTSVTNFGDAELAVNQPNAGGDIFTASVSGATKFVIGNNGTFQTNGATAVVGYNRIGTGTTANGLSTANDLFVTGKFEVSNALYVDSSLIETGSTGTVGWFQRNANALAPTYITDDFLVGGTATSSAKFALLNMAGGTPTASVAGSLVVMPYMNGTNQVGGNILINQTSGDGKSALDINAINGWGPRISSSATDLFTQFNNTTGDDWFFDSAGNSSLNGPAYFTIQPVLAQPVLSLAAKEHMGAGGSGGGLGINVPGVGTNSQIQATLDIRSGQATMPTASFSGATTNASLVIDQSGAGDILTASKSGSTKFTVKNSGVVVIGNSTNGIAFDPTLLTNSSGQIYFGTARPTRQIVLSPEYAGAVLTASGSAATNGFMTSDASPSATPSTYNFENYYQWTSTQTTPTALQQYTVAVKTTLPKDFSAWATSGNAISVDVYTDLTTTTSNKIDILAYRQSDGSMVYVDQGEKSSTAKQWRTAGVTSSQVQALNPGDTIVFYITLYARDGLNAMVGDIKLNYLSAF